MDGGGVGSIPEAELPNLLIQLGEKLQDPPEDIQQSLTLLDSAEDLFSGLGQKPSFPVLYSLTLAKEGLMMEKWFGSSNIHVRVSSLACIHELIRITAPDSPFEEEKMKEIYKETIKSFEHLSTGTGRCFVKATRILSLVANNKSVLRLLDVGCEPLVVQMLQIFLSNIWSDYPSDVASNMESLMTMLIMGARELSFDLLRPLVMSIRTENQDTSSPSSRSLAWKVLENCSTKAKPRLIQVAESLKEDLEASTNALSSLWPEIPADENVILPENGRAEQIEPLPSQLGTGKTLPKRKRGLPTKFLNEYVLYDTNKYSSSNVSTKRKKKEDLAIKNKEELHRGSDGCSTSTAGSVNPKRLKMFGNCMKNPEKLLGSRINVWRPERQQYYEGTVRSYDPTRKKHEVAYTDGTAERLLLNEKNWEFVPADEAENGREIPEPSLAEKDSEEGSNAES